ncbi:MAG: hypothetical protein ABF649_04925 [Bacillus sp. (in: firmicutes)]
MINNGYVNKEAIFFVMKEEKNISLGNTDYLLLQYNPENPNIKYVTIGDNIRIPPIKGKWQEGQEKTAIIGVNVDEKKVPNEYTNIQYFNTLKSYILNSEIWLISNQRQIEPQHGTHFILNTPKNNELIVLKKRLNEHKFTILDQENNGTYTLKSNITVPRGYLGQEIFPIQMLYFMTAFCYMS